MARLDWRKRVVCVPSQAPGLIEASGLEPAEVEAAAWALAPCGRWHRGAGAIAIALEQLLPGVSSDFSSLRYTYSSLLTTGY